MFERFTESARQVVVLAQEEARVLKHGYIGTEHILLGLLRSEQGFPPGLLEHLDITLDRVRADVRRIVGTGEGVISGQIPFTPRAKKVMELTLREALSLGHQQIGPEHILLGLLREGEGVATGILRDVGADAETLRHEVLRSLSGPAGRPLVDAPPPRPFAPPPLDWPRATLLWRPEGLELRIPLHLNQGAMATFAADEVWSTPLVAGLRREIWSGWLGLASPTLLDDTDPGALRRALDAAAEHAVGGSGDTGARAEDFLRRLRDQS